MTRPLLTTIHLDDDLDLEEAIREYMSTPLRPESTVRNAQAPPCVPLPHIETTLQYLQSEYRHIGDGELQPTKANMREVSTAIRDILDYINDYLITPYRPLYEVTPTDAT